MMKICFLVTIALLCSATSNAQLNVVGNGGEMNVDTSLFPPRMQDAYVLMKQKCGKCHTIERVIVSVQTGHCSLTKSPFTKDTAKSVITRMLLKPDSNMTRSEAKTILELINYMLDQNSNLAEKF